MTEQPYFETLADAPYDWVAWLVDLEEEYHARVILIEGHEGRAQAYLLPLPKEH